MSLIRRYSVFSCLLSFMKLSKYRHVIATPLMSDTSSYMPLVNFIILGISSPFIPSLFVVFSINIYESNGVITSITYSGINLISSVGVILYVGILFSR